MDEQNDSEYDAEFEAFYAQALEWLEQKEDAQKQTEVLQATV